MFVKVDMVRGTVAFYRNEAFVGVAIGPSNSGSELELVLGKGPYHPAVSLSTLGDSVSFVTRNFGSVGLGLGVDDDILPSWFIPLKDSIVLLRSCAARELPVSVILSDFIPQCSEKSKVVFETSHPYLGESLERTISVDGAESLNIAIGKESRMGAGDIVRYVHLHFEKINV